MSSLSKAGWLATAALLSACARPLPPPEMAATYRNVSSGGFQMQTIAPTRESESYTLCKAVWFASRRPVATIGLKTPFVRPTGYEGWIIREANVTIDPVPIPTPEFEIVDVARTAAQCRQAWAWYR